MTTQATVTTQQQAALTELPPPSSNFKRFLRVFLRRPVVIVGLLVILALILVAIFAPLIAPYDPYAQNLAKSLQPPGAEHLLGTDLLGRDVLSRIIYGARVSLMVGIVVVLLGGALGMTIGLISGYFGGILDTVLMRIVDSILAIPTIIFAMAIGAATGGGITNVILALGIAITPTYARLMRGQVLSIKQQDYVIAGELTGASSLRNILVHVLPNSISPLIVLLTMNLGMAILAEAGLSFLGLGVSPPQAAWGAMVNDGYRFLLQRPMLSVAPGLCVMIVVLAFNVVGDALRDALDPRLRGE